MKVKDDIYELGFNIEYVEYVDEMATKILRFVIEKIDGSNMDINDCELVSRKIEDKVDKLMKDKEYTLEIASPGMERQLKNLKLYNKYIGYNIYVKLFKKTEILKDVNLKEFEGKLLNVNEEYITIKSNIENIDITFNINIKEIATAHTVYDYTKLFKK